ncbi:glycosyltransferase family 39 protein [Bifidobacterium pullorum subsp. saeculare]|uniref:Glycosyltransferase family 39 protein n=1 Tax=Bifidobacterium pullorum subsp. saeculare TaxID=78257 RepID=A0A938WXI2_9BIFI|nr:glycosyltransferase family 39 protein [Bifidobacterium pullorum]MBM6698828.1 glycosyltransferase family 39 protein [Bifidobacterium pullorum subsp. saeculare]
MLAVDAHPPLYYLLLRGWTAVFGFSEPAMRAMGAALCELTVVATARLVTMLAGTRRMALALPFLVLGPLTLRYGYELRMYALTALLAVLGTIAMLRALRAERDAGGASARRRIWLWWVAYGIVVVAGMLTQYLMALVWLTQAIWLLVRTIRDGSGERASWRWLGAYALAVVLFLLWLPTAFDQFGHAVLPAMHGAFTPAALADLVMAWFTGLGAAHATGLVTLGLLAVAVVVVASCRQVPRRWRMLALMWLGPVLLLVLVAAVREPFMHGYGVLVMVRYTVMAMPFCYAFLGVLCADVALRDGGDGTARVAAAGDGRSRRTARLAAVCRRWGAWACVLTMVVAGDIALAVNGNTVYEQSRTPHARAVAAAVPCSARDIVVAADPFTATDAWWYYRACPGYRLIAPEGGLPSWGGYAPLRGTVPVIRSLDDLPAGVRSITVIQTFGAGRPPSATARHPLASCTDIGEYTVCRFR